jgi:hypothetical protein
MTDIVKLAYQAGVKQALNDLGMDKEASPWGFRRIGRMLGNADDIAYFTNKATQEALGAEAALVAKQQKAVAARELAEKAHLQALHRRELSQLSPQQLKDLQAGKINLSQEYENLYNKLHPAPAQTTAKKTRTPKQTGNAFTRNPLATAAGALALGGGGMYAYNKATEEKPFSQKVTDFLGM